MELIKLTKRIMHLEHLKKAIQDHDIQTVKSVIKFNILDDIYYLLMDLSLAEAEKTANNAILLAKQMNSLEYTYSFESSKYNSWIKMGKLDFVKKSIMLDENIHKKIKNPVLKMNFLLAKASYYSYTDIKHREKAEKIYKQTVKLSESLGDDFKIFQSIGNLMGYYVYWKMFDKAKKFIHKVLDHPIIKKRNRESLHYQSVIYNNLGVIYFREGNLKDALLYFEKAYKIAKKLGEISKKRRFLGNIAGIYFEKNDYRNAIKIFNRLLGTLSKNESYRNKVIWLKNLGLCYIRISEYKKAEKTYIKGINAAKKLKIHEKVLEIYFYLTLLYLRKNNLKKIKKNTLEIEKYQNMFMKNTNQHEYLCHKIILEVLQSKSEKRNIIKRYLYKFKDDEDMVKNIEMIQTILKI